MEIKTETTRAITPQALALALAGASPAEFAECWLAFHAACDEKMLDRFAQAMASRVGGNRKKPLRELCRLMEFYEIQNERMTPVSTDPA